MSQNHALQILHAYKRIQNHIHRTPVLTSQSLNKLAQAELYFKCENFQKCGSFKIRGAANQILQLENPQLGVCTHSSGNHGLGLAYMARMANIKAHIIVPENCPAVKRNTIEEFGAQVHVSGNSIPNREEKLKEIQEKYGCVEIHHGNQWRTIYGQATASYEMLIQTNFQLDYLVPPIGSGGFGSGTVLTAQHLSAGTKVYGAEPALAADAKESIRTGVIQPMPLPPRTIADGLRTKLGIEIIEMKILKKKLTLSQQYTKVQRTYFWLKMKKQLRL